MKKDKRTENSKRYSQSVSSPNLRFRVEGNGLYWKGWFSHFLLQMESFVCLPLPPLCLKYPLDRWPQRETPACFTNCCHLCLQNFQSDNKLESWYFKCQNSQRCRKHLHIHLHLIPNVWFSDKQLTFTHVQPSLKSNFNKMHNSNFDDLPDCSLLKVSYWDGSIGRGVCCQAQLLEFHPQDPHKKGKEWLLQVVLWSL